MQKLYDKGKLRVNFVNTKFNKANVCTKNVIEAIQSHHQDITCQGKIHSWRLYKSKVYKALREDLQTKEEDFAASKTLNFSAKTGDSTKMFAGYVSNISH